MATTFVNVTLVTLAAVFVCLQVATVTCSQSRNNDGASMPDEKRLIRHLLQTYEKAGVIGRPVTNTSVVLEVRFGITLIQIIDLDEKNQILTLNVWNNYEWTDSLLQWEPNDFGGVQSIRIPPQKIWMPDIVLFNYADERLKEQRDALVVVEHTGSVTWIPTAIYRSTCAIDIVHFPFDEQTCNLTFGSWTFDGRKLDITLLPAHKNEMLVTDTYTQSKEWDLLHYPAMKKTEIRHGVSYPVLVFTLKIRRTALTYTFLLIIPCILLSILNLVIFWLPPEAPAKMMLGITIFVAFFVLLQLLANLTPPSGDHIPKIGMYFCLNMVLITISTFIAVFILYLYFRGDRKNRMPEYVRTIVLYRLATILCMHNMLEKTDKPTELLNKVKVRRHCDNDTNHSHCSRKTTAVTHIRPPTVLDLRPLAARTELVPDKSPVAVSSISRGLETDIKEVKRLIRNYVTRLSEKEKTLVAAKEWRNLSRVIDRLFFYIYLVAIIVSLVTIFPRKA